VWRRIEFLDFMNRIAAAYPDPSFTSSLGLPRNGGHLMESSQGSEVTNGDEDPAIIRRRVQTGGGVTADIEWSTGDAGGESWVFNLRCCVTGAMTSKQMAL